MIIINYPMVAKSLPKAEKKVSGSVELPFLLPAEVVELLAPALLLAM
jgi:hypothetical protein